MIFCRYFPDDDLTMGTIELSSSFLARELLYHSMRKSYIFYADDIVRQIQNIDTALIPACRADNNGTEWRCILAPVRRLQFYGSYGYPTNTIECLLSTHSSVLCTVGRSAVLTP